MLTCDICGEAIMFEEDMRTHLLLSHLENDMHCPLCSLSGVSYDELCFHISSAHPDKQDQAHLTLPSGCSAETNAAVMESVDDCTATQLLLTQSCTAGDTCDGASTGTPTAASSVTTDSVPHKWNMTAESGGSSPGETLPTTSTLITQGSKTRLKSFLLCDEEYIGMKSEHSKAKQKRLSSPRKEELFSCPMCALVCSSSFILQEHVELHLQEEPSAEVATDTWPTGTLCGGAGGTWAGISGLSSHLVLSPASGRSSLKTREPTQGSNSPPLINFFSMPSVNSPHLLKIFFELYNVHGCQF
ncbi:zinc finger-containing ubiquitin peptidase 1-like isoform X3 [Sparus aurata]|nr:zinc finger-containing ubiquitin peptidase 1-like isoform X3 [Sparus aurata]